MRSIVTLKDNHTGITKQIIYEPTSYEPSREGIEFIWKEGNYSCDCNRYLFFYPDCDRDILYPCNGEEHRFELLELKII